MHDCFINIKRKWRELRWWFINSSPRNAKKILLINVLFRQLKKREQEGEMLKKQRNLALPYIPLSFFFTLISVKKTASHLNLLVVSNKWHCTRWQYCTTEVFWIKLKPQNHSQLYHRFLACVCQRTWLHFPICNKMNWSAKEYAWSRMKRLVKTFRCHCVVNLTIDFV